MEKFVVTDVVAGSDLGTVVCEHATVHLTITEDDASEEHVQLRVPSPPDVDGTPFGEWVIDRIHTLFDQAEDDDDRTCGSTPTGWRSSGTRIGKQSA